MSQIYSTVKKRTEDRLGERTKGPKADETDIKDKTKYLLKLSNE